MFERIITAPAIEPVTVEEQATFSRFDVPEETTGSPPAANPEYADVVEHIKAAREKIEQMASVACITQRWLMTLDAFPYYLDSAGCCHRDAIGLLRRPAQEAAGSPPVDNVVIKYKDCNGDLQTFDAANYEVFANKITLKQGKCWPITARVDDAVRVEYTTGYGEDADSVPARLKKAIMFLAGHWYETRVPVGTDPTEEMWMTLTSLLVGFKLNRVPR